jgi:predicted porin
MQKKLLAVAVAGALGAPALAMAQASTVQVFGTVYMEYGFVDQGDNKVNVDMFQTPGSEIGFKGEEKLGSGLSAWFQCNSTFDVRGSSPQGFCGRNSAIGFKGGFGNVFLGNWDTPFKRTMGPNRITNETGLFGASFLLTGGASSFNGRASAGSFSRRQNNSINYDSPNFGGFQVMASTTTINDATGTLSATTGGKARLWSIGAQYSAGPLYVSGAYETHRNYFSGPAAGYTGNDNGWHLGANYTFGGNIKVGGIYTRQKFETSATADAKVSVWHLGLDWKLSGPHGLRAGYTKAGDMKGTLGAQVDAGSGVTRPAVGGDTGADLWQISYVHALSKRTEATVGYVRLDNDRNSSYNLGGLSTPNSTGVNQDAFAFTVRHRF